MKTLSEHIAYIQEKPHHVRKQVAFGAAAFVSACIALVWLVGSYMTGAFAIAGSSFATASGQDGLTSVAGSPSNTDGIAGAAAALPTRADTSAHLEVIDTNSVAVPKQQSEPAILPF